MHFETKQHQKTFVIVVLFVRKLLIDLFELVLICFEFILGPEENIVAAKYNSKTICGEHPLGILNGDVTSYDKGICILHIQAKHIFIRLLKK